MGGRDNQEKKAQRITEISAWRLEKAHERGGGVISLNPPLSPWQLAAFPGAGAIGGRLV
jgi:hypothetical protein